MNPCAICGQVTGSEKFCGLCDAWLCDTCRSSPAARSLAAAKAAARRLRSSFASLLGKAV